MIDEWEVRDNAQFLRRETRFGTGTGFPVPWPTADH